MEGFVIPGIMRGGLRRGGLTPACAHMPEMAKGVPVCKSRLIVRQYCQGAFKKTILSEEKENAANTKRPNIAIRPGGSSG